MSKHIPIVSYSINQEDILTDLMGECPSKWSGEEPTESPNEPLCEYTGSDVVTENLFGGAYNGHEQCEQCSRISGALASAGAGGGGACSASGRNGECNFYVNRGYSLTFKGKTWFSAESSMSFTITYVQDSLTLSGPGGSVTNGRSDASMIVKCGVECAPYNIESAEYLWHGDTCCNLQGTFYEDGSMCGCGAGVCYQNTCRIFDYDQDICSKAPEGVWNPEGNIEKGAFCCGPEDDDDPDMGVECCKESTIGINVGKRVWQIPDEDGWVESNGGPCCGDDEGDTPEMGPICCEEGPLGLNPGKQVWQINAFGKEGGACCGNNESDDPDMGETCCLKGPIGNHTGSRFWEGEICCGDDEEDDPDVGPNCCISSLVGLNIGKRIWSSQATTLGGPCCGDDETDDPDMSELACETCVLGDYPGIGNNESDGERTWAPEISACCGDDMLEDCMQGDSKKVCVTIGGRSQGSTHSSLIPIITNTVNPPLNTSGSTWYWLYPSANTIEGNNINLAGQILNITCADYMIVSNGADWVTCSDYVVNSENHLSFELGDNNIIKSSSKPAIANPVFINNHDYFCYTLDTTTDDKRDNYIIAECCGNDSDNCHSQGGLGGLRHKTGHSVDRTVSHDDETYYCAFDSDWTTDLDNKDSYSCTESGFNWTGSYCCAEDDDRYSLNNYEGYLQGEWYNDVGGTGVCWNNTYQQNNGFLVEYNGTDVTHAYLELYILNGVVEGCAVDDRWAEARTPDSLDFTSPEKAQNKNKPYHGSLGNKSPSDFLQYDISSEHKGNDWLLYIDDNANPGNISIDKSSYPHGDNDEMVHDNAYCTYINRDDGYFCSWKEVWVPANGNMERTHLSYIPWSGDNTTQYAECCKPEQCWNGVQCINSQHDDATAEPYPGTDYRCLHGEWVEQPKKYTWDGLQDGYCEYDSQCLVSPSGNKDNNQNATAFYSNWDNTLSNPNYPQCINNGQYLFDHYCENGEWTSRSKLLALDLLDYAYSNSLSNYTLYCDYYNNVLAYTGYSIDSHQVSDYFGMNCDLSEDYNNYNFINCTNMLCILKHDEGTSFGIVLNQDIDNTNRNILQLFNQGNSACSNVAQGEEYGKCVADNLYYNPEKNMLVYHPYGDFTSTVSSSNLVAKFAAYIKDGLMAIFNRIMNVLKIKSPSGSTLPSDFLNDTSDYSRLFISRIGSKKVMGLQENQYVKYQGTPVLTDYIVIQYSGFDSNICDSLNLTDVSPNSCSRDGSNYVVRAKKDYWSNSKLFDYWNELTIGLRIVE